MNDDGLGAQDEIYASFEQFMRQECGLAEGEPLPWEHPYVSASWPVWEAAWKAAVESPVLGTSIWCHVKTGGLYALIARGLSEQDQTPVVIYRALADGQVWVRPAAEFDDGRFVAVDPSDGPG